MGVTEQFLLALLVILALPWLVWRGLALVWRGQGPQSWAPLVVVQIIAGILLGPGVLGHLWPVAHQAVFTQPVMAALGGVALWGVILFVWLAGLELELHQAWANRRETGIVAGLALTVPLVLGIGAALVLVQMPGWAGAGAATWQVVLGFGMACAVTALPILVLFLDELGLLAQPIGQRVLRFASVDDVAIWAVLAAILLDVERLGRQAAFAMAFALAAFLVRKGLVLLQPGDRLPVALVWLVASAFAADWSGLHYMVGAFLAGAVIDADWLDRPQLGQVRSAVLTLMMPVFFLSTGLRTGWEMGGLGVLLAAGLLLAAAVGGKLLGVALAGRWLGWPRNQAWLVGWLLQTKGLIMIIFATILLDRGILSDAAFTALLLMAVGSTMLTMPVVARLLHRDQNRTNR